MARAGKGLEGVVEMCIVDYHYTEQGIARDTPSNHAGLRFAAEGEVDGCSGDPVFGAAYLRDVYLKGCPEYAGVFSVPMLWDKKSAVVVNNESADIVRIFNTAFNHLAANPSLDLYPAGLRGEIDEWSSRITVPFMKAPRDAGMATSQEECTRPPPAMNAPQMNCTPTL